MVCREFYIAGRRRGTKSGNAGIGRGKHSRRVSGKSDTSESPLEEGEKRGAFGGLANRYPGRF